MYNMPNITPVEVAMVCTAALLLCILPNVLVWSDVRRQRREKRVRAEQAVLQRRASELSASELGQAPVVSGALVEGVVLDVVEAAQTMSEPAVVAQPDLAVSHVSEVDSPSLTAPIFPEPSREPVTPEPASMPSKTETYVASLPPADPSARYELRIEDLRRVKLPNWPPAEVRDNPEKKRVWEEAVRVAEQPLITRMQLRSSRVVESACLASAESIGSVLRLHFLLFADLWPVAADQATAEAIFEIDSASGDVRGSVRSL